MRTLKSLLVMTAVVGLVTVKVFAGPIPMPLLDPKNLTEKVVKGESTLYGKDGSYINVDWMVIWFGEPEVYGYYYQLENFSSTDVSSFTVIPYGEVYSIFVSPSGTDWDPAKQGGWPPLGAPLPYAQTHNLDGEVEPTGGLGNSPLSGGQGIDGSITWTWATDEQLLPNTETVIIGFLSPMPPTYGIAHAFDGRPTVGWGPEYNSSSQPVPVPSPEPTTTMLLLMGAIGVFWRIRRK